MSLRSQGGQWCLAIGVALLAMPGFARQSGNASQAGQSSEQKATSSSKPEQKKSAAQENPFPDAVSKQAAHQQNAPQQVPPAAPDAGQSNGSGASAGDAAKDNPFPEDVSRKAAKAASEADNSSAGESSSSSSSSAAPDAGDPNADVPPDTNTDRGGIRRRLRKPNPNDIQSGSLTGQARAKEDVQVGKFYLGDGDYPGAYARFSEASRLDPGNLDAIYLMATAADKMHRKDDALVNYKLYLEVAPDGSNAKAAKKAIQQLSK